MWQVSRHKDLTRVYDFVSAHETLIYKMEKLFSNPTKVTSNAVNFCYSFAIRRHYPPEEAHEMAHIITSLCLRDGKCVDVCPVECIIPGQPQAEWPWFYIDPDTCIDCGACVPECPFDAIFIEEEVPSDYAMAKGQQRLDHVSKELITYAGGEVVDLTVDTPFNAEFFNSGMGYDALNYTA